MYIFFNSTWFLQWHKRLRKADFKDPLLHVVQTDGSRKNIYLIIINPAYALQNSTLHIINYSSCHVFYASLRRKSKDWLARNQNNVSEWSDISTRWLLLAHLAKGNVSFYHRVAPVVCRLSSVYFSHFNLLLWNASAKWSET